MSFCSITCRKRFFFSVLDILFWNHLYGESLGSLPRRRPKGDSGGMLDECDELPLNIPLTSAWEARAWAACGVLCRPIFDSSSGQQIKIHSFSKPARVKWSKWTWRYLWLTQFQACPSSPQHLSFFGKSCKCPTMGPGVHENPTVRP